MNNNNVLVLDPKKCVGCRLCEQWCSIHHDGMISPARSRIRIVRDHQTQVDRGIYCRQCADTPCIDACKKFDALSRDEKTGAILVDKEQCVACKACIKACPFDAPSMHPDGETVIICDLCGGDPMCVNLCPETAIQLMAPEEADRIHQGSAVIGSGEVRK